uniref:Uncharacterized protein n=1 Tax=Glossina pallidipes TaxID=7398 RepID=A0A1A9ZUA4_GLOPL
MTLKLSVLFSTFAEITLVGNSRQQNTRMEYPKEYDNNDNNFSSRLCKASKLCHKHFFTHTRTKFIRFACVTYFTSWSISDNVDDDDDDDDDDNDNDDDNDDDDVPSASEDSMKNRTRSQCVVGAVS